MRTLVGATLTAWQLISFAQMWVAGELLDTLDTIPNTKQETDQ